MLMILSFFNSNLILLKLQFTLVLKILFTSFKFLNYHFILLNLIIYTSHWFYKQFSLSVLGHQIIIIFHDKQRFVLR